MTDWIVAPCLDTWLAQINKFAPRRSKKSDGSIGDAAHAETNSQHNPKLLPFFATPLVRARDFTHDPIGGFNCVWFVSELAKIRDPRVKYIIWDWRIWYPGTGWQKYDGRNGHTAHCHVSVTDNRIILGRGNLLIPQLDRAGLPSIPSLPPEGRRNLAETMTGDDVWELQDWLNIMYPAYKNTPIPRLKPPRFGPQTKAAVMEFQRAVGLAPDGIVGPQTWAAMRKEGFK